LLKLSITMDTYAHLFRETSTTAMSRLDQRLRTGLLDDPDVKKAPNPSNSYLTERAGTPPRTVEDDTNTDLANLVEDQRTEDITVTA
jgi:hypothetical protein